MTPGRAVWRALLAWGIFLLAALPARAQEAGASDDVYDAAPLPGGGAVLGGYFTAYDGQTRWRLARLRPNGTLDPGFDPGASSGSAPVNRVAALPDGKVIVAGPFTRFAGQRRALAARLRPDGVPDPAFQPDLTGDGLVNALLALPDGAVLVGGRLRAPDELRNALGSLVVRLRPDGRRDGRFACALPPQDKDDQATALALLPGGKLLLGTRHGVARLEGDGRLDPTFRPPPELSGAVQALAALPDGGVLLASARPPDGWRLLRLGADGQPDPAFHPADSAPQNPGAVNALLALPDGRALLAGSFREVGGARRHGLARLNADGSLDAAFAPGTGVETLPVDDPGETPEATVHALLPLPDGRLLAAGRFDLYNGTPCRNVAWVNPDGSGGPRISPASPAPPAPP